MYSELKKAINYIAYGPLGNAVVVSIGDYYVQFATCDTTGNIYIEAVSEQYNPKVQGVKKELKRLGYTLPRQDVECYNYQKVHTVQDVDKLIAEFKYIFECLYGVPFSDFTIILNGEEADADTDWSYYSRNGGATLQGGAPTPIDSTESDKYSSSTLKIVAIVLIALFLIGFLCKLLM